MQQLPPDRGQCFFFCALRRFVFGAGVCIVRRRGQCAPVQLAVRCQRPRVQPHVRRWHHVARQVLRGLRSQCHDIGIARVVRDEAFLDRCCRCCCRCCRGCGLGRGRRRIRSCVFRRAIVHLRCRISRKHDHLAHIRHLRQLRLDLSQLDPETAYLHLEVVSPQIFQTPVRAPTRQIPRPIQPPARHERIVDEPLPRQLRPVQVPPRHLHATDIQLPRHTDRRRTQPRIQHINPRIRDRTADGRRSLARLQAPRSRHHRRLGRPVVVDEHLPGRHRIGPAAKPVSADQQCPHAGIALPRRIREFGKRGHEKADVQLLRPPPAQQRLRIGGGVAGRERQAAAVAQRRPNLPRRRIERDARHARAAAARADIERARVPRHQITDAAMLDHHPLRLPRRARRIDHVSEMARRQAARRRIVVALVPPCAGIRFEIDQRTSGVQPREREHEPRLHRRAETRMREQCNGRAVAQQIIEPLRRISRIERHVCAARLEHGQHRDDHVDAAIDADRHALVRLQPSCAQVTGEPVRTAIQFGITDRLAVRDQRDRVRMPRGLRLEQAMQTLILRIVGGRVVPFDEQTVTLFARQHVDVAHGDARHNNARRGNARSTVECAHELFERGLHESTNALGRRGMARLNGHRKRFAEIVDRYGQRIIGALVAVQVLDIVVVPRWPGCLLAMPVVEQRREQRLPGRQSAASQGERERRMFVINELHHPLMRVRQTLGNIPLIDVDPDRQRIDEHAHAALAALHAAEQHRAEHRFPSAGGAREHHRPCQVHQACRTDAEPPRADTNRLRQFGRQPLLKLRDLSAVALYILQSERMRGAVDVAEHCAEECFMLPSIDAGCDLRDEVAKRRGRRQRVESALLNRLLLGNEQLQRRVVDRQMMSHHAQQPAAGGGIMSRVTAQQRRPTDVEAVRTGIVSRLQLPQDVAVSRIEIDEFDRQAHATLHDLHRLLESLPEKTGAQDVVPIDDHPQRVEEAIETRPRTEADEIGFHVRIAFGMQQMVEYHAFLQWRERIDVLYVGGAAFDLHREHVDLRLGQRDERQHVGRDARGARGNQVRRCLDRSIVGLRTRRKVGQRLRVEYAAYVGMEPLAAHAFDHADSQQRVAAEFEEVVVAADALHMQQLPPDRGQCFFFCALRRFVFGAGVCIVRRRGQCAPVQLAVRC
ncbi:Uncharacterised protein [Burkholderia pseudomallei]|nr:Uncharacterised protein [Burkholderia pseudomallei]CAJ4571716.1 Uncharacterised protein [Burkholderia pseudomallei]CAJ9793277.1 Uncharacterised protein [Burkholderia pseudomallei]CAK0568436.1 Uncharacterised protein [Burkholderia pseudomallei]VCN61513.1 Uncharacterised protein [Burkholderia pseudomallei]